MCTARICSSSHQPRCAGTIPELHVLRDKPGTNTSLQDFTPQLCHLKISRLSWGSWPFPLSPCEGIKLTPVRKINVVSKALIRRMKSVLCRGLCRGLGDGVGKSGLGLSRAWKLIQRVGFWGGSGCESLIWRWFSCFHPVSILVEQHFYEISEIQGYSGEESLGNTRADPERSGLPWIWRN